MNVTTASIGLAEKLKNLLDEEGYLEAALKQNEAIKMKQIAIARWQG